VLLIALALVQFALFYHAQSAVTGAVQDGARIAAAEDRSVSDGIAHTQTLLNAGLGASVGDVQVSGQDDGETVSIEARGHLQLIIPWVTDMTLPLEARAMMSKERFRSGPNQ
jgi:Flp pilus assembly protein TadG